MTAARGSAAVLLAAGLSTRMGTPKPLLDWCGRPLVVHQVHALQEAGLEQVIAVTGHAADGVEAALADLGVTLVRNPDYAAGRATSIRAGARAVPDAARSCLFLNVDQPRRAATLRRLLEWHEESGALLSVPVYQGRRGHPVVFDGALLPELRAVTEEGQGLREVVHRHAAQRCELPVDTDEVLLDVNDPDAYTRALAAW